MTADTSLNLSKNALKLQLCQRRRLVWWISGIALSLSSLGLILCLINPAIKAPLRPGLDFTGGTQIQLERVCNSSCESISASMISDVLRDLPLTNNDGTSSPNLSQSRVQFLDGSQSLVLRLPFLSASQGQSVIEAIRPLAGPFKPGGQAVDTIGPSLGGQLLKSSILSLLVAFTGIAFYINLRYDRRFALLALIIIKLKRPTR